MPPEAPNTAYLDITTILTFFVDIYAGEKEILTGKLGTRSRDVRKEEKQRSFTSQVGARESSLVC